MRTGPNPDVFKRGAKMDVLGVLMKHYWCEEKNVCEGSEKAPVPPDHIPGQHVQLWPSAFGPARMARSSFHASPPRVPIPIYEYCTPPSVVSDLAILRSGREFS